MIKQKIYVKLHNEKCRLESHGNWIDLRTSKYYELEKEEHLLIDLGVSIKLPKYYQANIVPRSGTFRKYGLLQTNHYGVIDGPTSTESGYSGNNDRWIFSVYGTRKANIFGGDRLCQFEIRPTMFAPFWVKLKWLFTSGIEIIYVDNLDSEDRGGFGSTGK